MLRASYPYDGKYAGSLAFAKDDIFLKLREESELWSLVATLEGILGFVPANYVYEDTTISKELILIGIENTLGALKVNELLKKQDRESIEQQLVKLKLKFSEKKSETRVVDPPSTALQPCDVPKALAFELVDSLRLLTDSNYDKCHQALEAVLQQLKISMPYMKSPCDTLQSQLYDRVEFKKHLLNCPDRTLLMNYFKYFDAKVRDDQESGWALHETKHEFKDQLAKCIDLMHKVNVCLLVLVLNELDLKPILDLIALHQNQKDLEIRSYLLASLAICLSSHPACVNLSVNSNLPGELIRELTNLSADEQHNLLNFSITLQVLTMMVCTRQNTVFITIPVHLKAQLNITFFNSILHNVKLLEASNSSPTLNAINNATLKKNGSSFLNRSESMTAAAATEVNPAIEYIQEFVLGLLVACNTHFVAMPAEPSPVIESLKKNPDLALPYIEKLIKAFNRDTDPSQVDGFELLSSLDRHAVNSARDDNLQQQQVLCPSRVNLFNDNSPFQTEMPMKDNMTAPQPVRKLLYDIFSDFEACNLIYFNDLCVIVDVIGRQICDLMNDKNLVDYLLLLHSVVNSANFQSRPYKLSWLIDVMDDCKNNLKDYNHHEALDAQKAFTLTDKLLESLSKCKC